jgi:N-methylhydantoinase B
MAEVKYLVDTVVASAFGPIVPHLMVGDFKGTGNHVYISGKNDQNRGFILYEWPAGGTGASEGNDGNNAVRGFTEGDFGSIHPVEMIEREYPLRIERCQLRTGSCGDGKNRGGLGLHREVRILAKEASLSVLSEKNILPPYGVAGGTSGAPNRFTVIRDGKIIEPSPIPGKVSGFPLRFGDIVSEESAGGGGHGDPLDRDLNLVEQDVRAGYLTLDDARNRYGVVFNTHAEIDAEQTARAKSEIRNKRISAIVEGGEEDYFDEQRRLFLFPVGWCQLASIQSNDVVELCHGQTAALRGWASTSSKVKPGSIIVGLQALRLLQVSSGQTVEVRKIQTNR